MKKSILTVLMATMISLLFYNSIPVLAICIIVVFALELLFG